MTISRTLFRNGGSEYAINGRTCRLLDIQELLSDTGMGRSMHVVVGQGKLDEVLRATPEDMRAFVEEAAGVLKHRRRKEKALRKLDAMAANLTRATDLTAEIRRQLGPLGRQAEVARKAAVVQADLRDARARLLADDLAQLQAQLAQEVADETALRERRDEVETQLTTTRARLAALEREAAEAAPRATEAGELWYRLSALRERLRGTASLAADRARLLGEPGAERAPGQDVDELVAQAERVRAAEAELVAEVEVARAALEVAVVARQAAEQEAQAAERDLAGALRAAADRREGVARLAGQVGARRSRLEANGEEIGRLRAALAAAESRAHEATTAFAALETQVTGAEEGEEGLDAAHEAAAAGVEDAHARVSALSDELAAAERERGALTARAETLELSLSRKDGAGALLAADALTGTIGSVAALLSVDPRDEEAIVAALGPLADAVAVESVEAAVDAIRYLRTEDAGRATLLVGSPDDDIRALGELPAGAQPAIELVQAPSRVRPTVRALLAGVVVVDDLAAARAVLAARPDLVVATRAGDLLSGRRASGGSSGAPSALHLQAALDQARSGAQAATATAERLRFELVAAQQARADAQAEYDRTLDRLNESDAALAAVAEQLANLGSVARSARAEADRLQASLDTATHALEDDTAALAELTARLGAVEAEPAESEASIATGTADRDRLAGAAAHGRARETEARLTLRTAEERARALAGRAESLERAAQAEREARERVARREVARARQAATARAVHAGAVRTLVVLERSLTRASDERAAAEAARAERDAHLVAARSAAESLAAELAQLTDVAHRDEVARTQQRLRVEAMEQRSVQELGVDPEVLVDEYGPHRSVPVVVTGDTAPADAPAEVPYVREQQEKRLAAAERALALLGRVNPLALEEFEALEERHRFLTEQLADLKKSRADLMQIVADIDERVEQVFAEAFADTAAQFEVVFPRLFPGGEGRLVLTSPDDMLATGVEVEARPAGKKVKRLSLLSGGERSLTAVALLVSIFRARPSPFYVMDEVEAALDDTNLDRLLELLRELRASSQLIVVTHQKRTMEIADALYGVTMRGDGVSTVISQRLREDVPA
ncbi:MAG TPA: chromosome segregation protein SMC [Cellulomonas sp.]